MEDGRMDGGLLFMEDLLDGGFPSNIDSWHYMSIVALALIRQPWSIARSPVRSVLDSL